MLQPDYCTNTLKHCKTPRSYSSNVDDLEHLPEAPGGNDQGSPMEEDNWNTERATQGAQ